MSIVHILIFVQLTTAFVKQPYLQNLTDSSVVVKWETYSEQPGVIEYGLTQSYGFEVFHSDSTIQHELLLAPLLKDTLYHYRVISGADTSSDYAFHTPVSANVRFRFMVIGDTRTDSVAHQSVLDRALQINPKPCFVIHTGDLTAQGTLEQYQTFFNVEKNLICSAPLFPCLGNHDLEHMGNWYSFFALPGNERWYTFYYGNASFHSLDNYSPYEYGTEQYYWLLNELLADSANSAIRHIFVFFHEPPYTTNQGHSSNLIIREHLCPLFERFGVKIAFLGHCHCYEHSFANDVHYIISGGGGAPLHYDWDSTQSWTVYRETTYELVIIDIKGDTVFSQGIKPDGEIFDTFSIYPQQQVLRDNRMIEQSAFSIVVSPSIFRRSFSISLDIRGAEHVKINMFNVLGQNVRTICNDMLKSGKYQFRYYDALLPSGIYFCLINIANKRHVFPLVKLR